MFLDEVVPEVLIEKPLDKGLVFLPKLPDRVDPRPFALLDIGLAHILYFLQLLIPELDAPFDELLRARLLLLRSHRVYESPALLVLSAERKEPLACKPRSPVESRNLELLCLPQ